MPIPGAGWAACVGSASADCDKVGDDTVGSRVTGCARAVVAALTLTAVFSPDVLRDVRSEAAGNGTVGLDLALAWLGAGAAAAGCSAGLDAVPDKEKF